MQYPENRITWQDKTISKTMRVLQNDVCSHKVFLQLSSGDLWDLKGSYIHPEINVLSNVFVFVSLI